MRVGRSARTIHGESPRSWSPHSGSSVASPAAHPTVARTEQPAAATIEPNGTNFSPMSSRFSSSSESSDSSVPSWYIERPLVPPGPAPVYDGRARRLDAVHRSAHSSSAHTSSSPPAISHRRSPTASTSDARFRAARMATTSCSSARGHSPLGSAPLTQMSTPRSRRVVTARSKRASVLVSAPSQPDTATGAGRGAGEIPPPSVFVPTSVTLSSGSERGVTVTPPASPPASPPSALGSRLAPSPSPIASNSSSESESDGKPSFFGIDSSNTTRACLGSATAPPSPSPEPEPLPEPSPSPSPAPATPAAAASATPGAATVLATRTLTLRSSRDEARATSDGASGPPPPSEATAAWSGVCGDRLHDSLIACAAACSPAHDELSGSRCRRSWCARGSATVEGKRGGRS